MSTVNTVTTTASSEVLLDPTRLAEEEEEEQIQEMEGIRDTDIRKFWYRYYCDSEGRYRKSSIIM